MAYTPGEQAMTIQNLMSVFFKRNNVDLVRGMTDDELRVTNRNAYDVKLWNIRVPAGETKRIAITQSADIPLLFERYTENG